jgi:hypothetical protein
MSQSIISWRYRLLFDPEGQYLAARLRIELAVKILESVKDKSFLLRILYYDVKKNYESMDPSYARMIGNEPL